MLNVLKKFFGAGPSVNYKELTEKRAVIVDVRTVEEFKTGHIKNSINVPLDTISTRLPMIKKIDKPVIVVCRSGLRSGVAVDILKNSGIEAYNGGAWNVLKNKIA